MCEIIKLPGISLNVTILPSYTLILIVAFKSSFSYISKFGISINQLSSFIKFIIFIVVTHKVLVANYFISGNGQYKEAYWRTMEIPQRTRSFNSNCRIQIYSVYLQFRDN